MKVFLSWSGEPSRHIAETLKSWLVQVIQALDPWISTGIEKGKRWNGDIADKLQASKVGIFCLTKDNLESPWLHFEAGAISKTPDAYVCTFLYNLKPSDIKAPLADFQATVFEKEDVFKLMKDINAKLEEFGSKPLTNETLIGVFETFYPQLEQKLEKTPEVKIETEVRTERELLEEILALTRSIKNRDDNATLALDHSIPMERKIELRLNVARTLRKFIELNGLRSEDVKESLDQLIMYALKSPTITRFNKNEISQEILKQLDEIILHDRLVAAHKRDFEDQGK